MRYPPLSPSIDAGARVVFEALAATVEVASRSDHQAVFPRYAGYYALLSHLPRRLRRQLQRRWRRSLGGIALLCALGQAPALAATIAVDGTSCTLIDAITAANTDAPTGGCPGGSGPDTLTLAANSTHILTAINNTTFGYNGLPVIGSRITIEGHGTTIRRDSSAPAFRIFSVNGTGNLTLNETTVSGGTAMDIAGYSGPGDGAGGGIFGVLDGEITVNEQRCLGQ